MSYTGVTSVQCRSTVPITSSFRSLRKRTRATAIETEIAYRHNVVEVIVDVAAEIDVTVPTNCCPSPTDLSALPGGDGE